MTEEEVRTQIGHFSKDDNSGCRWTGIEGAICRTFYIREGEVVAVTGTRLDYDGSPYFEEGQAVKTVTDRLGVVPMSYDIPGYGSLCYSTLGMIASAER